MLSKFADESALESSIFLPKASFERSLFKNLLGIERGVELM